MYYVLTGVVGLCSYLLRCIRKSWSVCLGCDVGHYAGLTVAKTVSRLQQSHGDTLRPIHCNGDPKKFLTDNGGEFRNVREMQILSLN